jgi:hypothetical protein
MAGSVISCFADPALVEEAKERFKEELGDFTYTSLLPPDQKPPIDLNRDTMEKFRSLMAKHYLKDTPEFVE